MERSQIRTGEGAVLVSTTRDPQVEFLRHALATLAYRGGRALRGAPADFDSFRAGEGSRTAGEILDHMLDLLGWSHHVMTGEEMERDRGPLTWEQGVAGFHAGLERLDGALADGALGFPPTKLFQGPIADALTHIGQIALLRGLAGSPIAGESFIKANIVAGRLGPDQEQLREDLE